MKLERLSPLLVFCAAICSFAAPAIGWAENDQAIPSPVASVETTFSASVQPLVRKYCLRCHSAETMKSGIRLDLLDGKLEDRNLFLWEGILKQLEEGVMPPEDELQPTAIERQSIVDWIPQAIAAARSRNTAKNGSVRRLTVAQYRNTLKDLLGLEEDLTDVLPPDALSKDGFANHDQTMLLSPLLVEAYFDIAEKALDLCIVDEKTKPVVQTFRMELGKAINPDPYPGKLILGANNHLLQNEDFLVTQSLPTKPFEFEPFRMRTKYRFNEGYEGNSTVRGWREYDSIYHSVFACMRGNEGYPKGNAYETIPEGLLLRPAIPSAELFQVESTYGPKANFKISLRELPDHGDFRVTVKAARYDDGLLLDSGIMSRDESTEATITVDKLTGTQTAIIEEAGIYQVDVHLNSADDEPQNLALTLGNRHFSAILRQPAFIAVRLPAGPLKMSAQYGGNTKLDRIVFTRLNETEDIAKQFSAIEARRPRIGVHVGLRRDCGSTFSPVGAPQTVSSTQLDEFIFEGAINNYPSPDVEKDNINYLAGIREIGVRSEYTDGRDMPRLLIRSIEFEGPFYKNWPPASHRNIFIESNNTNDTPRYAREIIRTFATRAFRRPVTKAEEASLFSVWKSSFAEQGDFQQSIKDALLVVLTSPQFVFLVENSSGPEPEELDSYELASKLSYFLWNEAPDRRLLELAAADALHESLDAESDRMMQSPRFEQFIDEFTSQWLRLDKLDVVEVDRARVPQLTRTTKSELRKEPARFLRYLIQHNLPLRTLIHSDFVLANEVVASYYDLGDRTESGFEFVRLTHEDANLGGVLTQAGILAGLSDGRESNPIKRGAWFARKIIAEPPDDPPPNVPQLMEDESHLTLRERLEQHRNQEGCAKCHAGIDPWGIPFEKFDAGGRFKKDMIVDARSTLPDKTEVADVNGLKDYLLDRRMDQVAFSFLKHLASYAVGRSLTYNEIVFLREKSVELKPDDYPMQDMIRFVIQSDIFLKK